MKMKIAILGSTGSIGKSTLDVIRKDKNFFEVVLLSANNNYKKLIKQAKEFNVKNVLIKNKIFHERTERSLKNSKTKVYSGDISITNIISKKLDYTMAAIVGVAGLQPTIDAIKISKTVALANKESIICGWEILSKLIKKYKTKILPVDSEHFSIMELTKDISDEEVEEIIITASGGPFLNIPQNKLSYVKPTQAINHPNWKMGKKISVDSANLMNKVFEIMEASKMFNFDLEKYKIFIHPQSYAHTIIKFKNGLIKMLLHDTDMKIPIFNSIYDKKIKYITSKKINSKTLNNLNFYEVDKLKFPSIKLLKKISKKNTLYDTVIIIANEELVKLFLLNKISLRQIVENLTKIINLKECKKYFKKKPTSLSKIVKVSELVRLKTNGISV